MHGGGRGRALRHGFGPAGWGSRAFEKGTRSTTCEQRSGRFRRGLRGGGRGKGRMRGGGRGRRRGNAALHRRHIQDIEPEPAEKQRKEEAAGHQERNVGRRGRRCRGRGRRPREARNHSIVIAYPGRHQSFPSSRSRAPRVFRRRSGQRGKSRAPE